ncbi:HTH domain-containing protein [Lactococcus raffinolactis]|nr:HTH domain-containing protein [Lactococcus raffinolactis]
MLVTKREQQIIDEIVKKGQVSIADLLDVVGVSRRTLYRDLQNLQDFLPKYQVNLIKIDQYYTLKGELSNLTDKRVVEEYSQNERHFMELILLIFEQAKLADFMNRFAISQPTATGDLKIIEQNLTFAGNGLVREGGLEVIASEYSKRTLLVSCLVSNLSTRDIFNFSATIYQENKMVQLFQQAYFDSVTTAFERSKINNISDRTQGILRLFFIVTLERLGQNHLIENHYNFRPSKKALDFVTKIVQNLPNFRVNLPEMANCKSKLATQINLYRRAVIKHFSWIVIHPNFNLSDLFRGRFYCAFRQKSTNHAIVILVSSSFPTRIGMSIVNITINCLR